MLQVRFAPRAARRCTLITIIFVSGAIANHGPGASGGGASTISGEVLRPGSVELSFREDFSKFEHFGESAAIRRAQRGGDFDALDHGFITSADFAVGVLPDLQLSASIGYFKGNDFLSADAEAGGDVEVSRTNPSGFTDLSLLAKYRFISGEPGNIAVVGGVIIPTGRSDVHLANGESLSPTDQPGTGRWGIPIGLGYSRFLTPKVTLDASALYTLRFEKDDFKVGDRIDVGAALAYRITDSIKSFPQWSIFGEVNGVHLFKDRANGSDDPNSGSDVLYFTPGTRVRFTDHIAFTVAPSIPIWQNVNGDQGKVDFKLSATLSFSF